MKKDAPVTPRCCKAAQEFPVVHLALKGMIDKPSDECTAVWSMEVSDQVIQQWLATHRPKNLSAPYEPTPPVAFCPFCGTKLPTPVKKAKPPKVGIWNDGYCEVCGERTMNCNCRVPEQAWEASKS